MLKQFFLQYKSMCTAYMYYSMNECITFGAVCRLTCAYAKAVHYACIMYYLRSLVIGRLCIEHPYTCVGRYGPAQLTVLESLATRTG